MAVGTSVRTRWQKELWGTVMACEVGGRSTKGVYKGMGGSAGRPPRESTESSYDLWKLLESSRSMYDTMVEMTWRDMIRDQS